MGLDGVELVMEIKDEFQITLGHAEAGDAETVGDVVDLVYAHLRKNQSDACPSQHGFHVVRQHLMEQLGVERAAIKPDSTLANFIAESEMPKTSDEFLKSLIEPQRGPLPPIRMYSIANNTTALILVALSIFVIWALVMPPWSLAIGSAVALGAGVLICCRMKPLETELPPETPPESASVRDLIKCISTFDTDIWTKDRVYRRVRDISVDLLGVKPEQVTLDARWAKDLHVG